MVDPPKENKLGSSKPKEPMSNGRKFWLAVVKPTLLFLLLLLQPLFSYGLPTLMGYVWIRNDWDNSLTSIFSMLKVAFIWNVGQLFVVNSFLCILLRMDYYWTRKVVHHKYTDFLMDLVRQNVNCGVIVFNALLYLYVFIDVAPYFPPTDLFSGNATNMTVPASSVILILGHIGVPKAKSSDYIIKPAVRQGIVGCVLNSGRQSQWEGLVDRTNSCVQKFSNINSHSFHKFPMGRQDAFKIFIPLLGEHSVQCFELTIGIGVDTQFEISFRDRYPSCRLFSIQPGYLTNLTFTFGSNGTGTPPPTFGVVEARLRDDWTFRRHIELVPLPNLLDKYVGSRVVHFVAIDIDGFEFTLLDALRYDEDFDRADVVFCQIDVELHGKDKQMEGFDFELFLPHFLAGSPYVPVFASTFLDNHIKILLVHSESGQCNDAFGFDSYFM